MSTENGERNTEWAADGDVPPPPNYFQPHDYYNYFAWGERKKDANTTDIMRKKSIIVQMKMRERKVYCTSASKKSGDEVGRCLGPSTKSRIRT